MYKEKDLYYLIDKIVASDLFWNANYYFWSMKKFPHGGVMRIIYPNVYLNYYPVDPSWLFIREPRNIPYF